MMLKTVDFPQPDGPMTDRNSPRLTANEMFSTARIGPSGVSNCFTRSSTTRTRSADVTEERTMGATVSRCAMAVPSVARLEHGAAHGRGVTRLDPHIDDRDAALLDGGDGLRIGGREFVVSGNGA